MKAPRLLCSIIIGTILAFAPAIALGLANHAPCPADNAGWVNLEREKGLEEVFLRAVEEEIGTVLVGVYGIRSPFYNQRITTIQRNSQYPGIMRVIVVVDTFTGAHNTIGVDTIEFLNDPHFRVNRVCHQKPTGSLSE